MAYRGIDVRDVWRPGSGMTARRLRVLIRHLPPESATMTALRVEQEDQDGGPPSKRERDTADPREPMRRPWSRTDLLLAELVDRINDLAWITSVANGGKKNRRPEPLVRPGVWPKDSKPRKKKPELSDEGAQLLFQLLRGSPSEDQEGGEAWRPSA